MSSRAEPSAYAFDHFFDQNAALLSKEGEDGGSGDGSTESDDDDDDEDDEDGDDDDDDDEIIELEQVEVNNEKKNIIDLTIHVVSYVTGGARSRL